MVRMGPDAFKTLVGMASSFQELANPDGVHLPQPEKLR